ncbi:MAG: DUF47 family protein, partial [Deltaproteobacteria bacterium]|nr:DUF47 family protein [Deltaproteobacteria bacterium]
MRLFPRDEEYFSLFEKASKNSKEAAYLLRDLVEHFQDVPQKAKKIKDLEHEGDLITHETIAKLNKTFVTPIDREDIHALICA